MPRRRPIHTPLAQTARDQNKDKIVPDRWYNLIGHPEQVRLIKSTSRFKVVPAGRRCLAKGTLVATPTGPVRIEDLCVGDLVIGYNEKSRPEITTVSRTWFNGIQEVTELTSFKKPVLAGTSNHKLLACHEMLFDSHRSDRVRHRSRYKRREVSELTHHHCVKKAYCLDLIEGGIKSVKNTYALGAFLGDGCCRESKATTGVFQKNLYISSSDSLVPAHIANMLGCSYKRNHADNHTYKIQYGKGVLDAIPFYREWAHGRYAHEKIAVLEEIDQWDKVTALSFLAGVLDTDGCVYYKNDEGTDACLSMGMQAKSVIEACAHIVHKYFQHRLVIHEDGKEGKYVNGPIHEWKVSANNLIKRILDALDPYLVKFKGFDTSNLRERGILQNRMGLKRGISYETHTYDITVANETNLYILHDHAVVTSNSGKTERAKRYTAKEAMMYSNGMYFLAAPTFAQAKRIWWKDLKSLVFPFMIAKISESDLIIFLKNGSEIHVVGLDKPARLEGQPWTGGVVDEIADTKPDVWGDHLRPLFDTIGLETWCWLIGVPDGLNHYYDLAEYAKSSGDPEWDIFQWKSADILPAKAIEAAKRQLSPRQFRQEYEASFETATGRVYPDYNDENHTDRVFDPSRPMIWTHDFNYSPLSSAIMQKDDIGNYHVVDEITLESAIVNNACEEFIDRYQGYNQLVKVYGDSSGHKGAKHGQTSDYKVIRDMLHANGFRCKMKAATSNPAIKDGQNALRAMILNADMEMRWFVNPAKCPYMDKGMKTLQLKKGSTFQEVDTDYQHITTAMRYYMHAEHPANRRRGKQKKLIMG